MAATNSSSTGRKNFYNIAYGKLSTRVKEITDDLTEITEESLKSMTQKVENIDLRNKYQLKGGDYPYTVYYDTIEGTIKNIKKDEYDKGVSLHVEITDTDGDNSVIQVKFYSKYTENLLNRLANVKDTSSTFSLTPYAIPSEFEIEGVSRKVYNQGVSLKEDGVKTEVAFKNDNEKLPKTVMVENAEGKMQTSRVKRINFLFDEVLKKFANNGEKPAGKEKPAKNEKPTGKAEKPDTNQDVDDDDLPF